MKWILAILLLISYNAIGQTDDTDKYIWYKFQYGSRMARFWSDSLLKAGGLVKFTGLASSTDTALNKPIAVNASGNVVKMGSWPHPPAIDTANKWINDIRRRSGTDSVEAFKNGTWQFKYKDSTGGGGGVLSQNSTGDSLGTGSTMSVRVQEVANDNNNPCYWCDITLSLPKSKFAHIRDTFSLVQDSTHLNIFIGPGTHSYGEDYSRYQMNMVDLLLAKYPFAGPGLFSGNMANYQFSAATGWTLRTLLTSPKGRGIAGQSLISTVTDMTIASGSNWPANSYNSYQDIMIITYDTATGGEFSIEVDGVLIDTINTALGTGPTFHNYHLSVNSKHTITLHQVTAGTTNCELLDVYLYTRNKRGIIVNKAALGSTAVTHWVAQNREQAIAMLQAIPQGVDLIISDLAVNNQNQNVDTNTARINQDTLIKRWRVASPNIGIILMKGTQYSFTRYGTPIHSIASYSRQLDQLARVDSVATFNTDRIVGPFPRSLSIKTVTMDSLHPTSQSFYSICADLLTNIGAFNMDIGVKEPNLFTGPDSSHVVNPLGTQRYSIWDINTWKNSGLNTLIRINSTATQSLTEDITSVNQVNYTSQGGVNTSYTWDGSGTFAGRIVSNSTLLGSTIKGRLTLGNSGGTENVFIKDATSKGYTDVTIDPTAASGYAWLKLNDGGGTEQGRVITLGSSAGIGSAGTIFENSAFAIAAQSGNMNIGTTANNTFRIFSGGSAATNVRMSITGSGAITFNNGSSSYTLPSARASAGGVLTDVSGTGALTWETPAGPATTLYTGDGTLAGNRVVTGNNLSLTFDDIFAFHVNSDYNVKAKANGTGIYSEAVVGAGNVYEIGYTPVAGIFSKGAGVFIDTNNNVGMGAQPPTAMPLYATGASTFVQGLQSNGGNFNKVENHTANFSVNLSGYFHTIDATAGNIVATLPAASTAFGNTMGIKYVFQRIDNSGNTVTIQRAGSDTINGGTSFTLTTQYTDIKIVQCSSTSTWAQY